MRKPTRYVLLALVLLVAGCAHHAAPQAKLAAAQTRLPDWAPKHPSPQFLRAWKVLKPAPDEEFKKAFGNDPTAGAAAQRARMRWPVAYEFFGTLDDRQVAQFLGDRNAKTQKKLLIPVKSLTPRQRAAFDAWVRACSESSSGQPRSDYLVGIYKQGGKQDLSNVRVGFMANSNHAVQVLYCVHRADGTDDGSCTWFATL